MKVRELIQDLLLANPEWEVFVASDAEGNSVNAYEDWSAETINEDGELLWDDPSDRNAIVIWPV